MACDLETVLDYLFDRKAQAVTEVEGSRLAWNECLEREDMCLRQI